MKSLKHQLRYTILSIIAMTGTCAASKDFLLEKERIRSEISKTITDQALINEITELRFKKEVLDKYVNVTQYPPIPNDQLPLAQKSSDCRKAFVQFPPVPCSDSTNSPVVSSTAAPNQVAPLTQHVQVESKITTGTEAIAKEKLLIVNSSLGANRAETSSSNTELVQIGKQTSTSPVVASQVINNQRTLSTEQEHHSRTREIQPSDSPSVSVYAGVGSNLTVGVESKLTDNAAARLQYSGTPSSAGTKSVNNSSYQYDSHDQSVALLLDWYPTESQLRLTGGLSFNSSSTTLNGAQNSIVRINGNVVNLGTDIYFIEYKLPKVTPYIGIGYSTKKEHVSGLSFFGELGMRIGKYNATTTTSLINSQNVKASDISSEMSSIQKSLYKWSFVPSAQVGLTYRFN